MSSEPPRYAVRLRNRRVQREMDALPAPDHRRVIAALHALAGNPRPSGSKKLYDNVYRVRAGSYRVIYFIDESNHRIEVGGVLRRSEKTYRGLEDLFDP
ncbi:MAG: type II toxin-antitoxin system RelE/ParE family toxin [Chloroflexi bacterium]|nr:type II toxin-antitoxin system RelE/ParE family toxin [Chloroflexota bacterium]